MRAAVYCRISRDTEESGLGVARQEKDCRALIERNGWDFAGVYTDNDISAYTGKTRPRYNALCKLIADGEIDVLVAWHPDRITRSPKELETLIDVLDAAKCQVSTVQSGLVDLSTPSGRMTARIIGSVARYESEHKSARLRRKHLELAEAGAISGGGGRPFGYDMARINVIESEAVVIRDVVARLLAGESLRSLCAMLDSQGHHPSEAGRWSATSLKRMATSGRIAGLRVHHGEVVGQAVWPAIITPDEHYRIKAMLDDPARRLNRGIQKKLLTGLLVCELCGARMNSRPRGDGKACYVCATGVGAHGCGQIRILGEPLDELVTEAVFLRLDTPAMADAVANRGTVAPVVVDVEQERIEARRIELADMWAAGDIDRASWKAATAKLQEQADAVAVALRADVRSSAITPRLTDLRGSWEGLTADQKRATLAALIDTITIGPAIRGLGRFDGRRATVNWKF